MNLFPVILFAYNRPWHTEQVLKALQRNTLAKDSHLIVFADGPKTDTPDTQRELIEKVRLVVQKDKWCGSVEFHFSDTNLGCRNSIINGISQVLKEYKAAIVLEDDIVTSPYFLQFMNQCLNYYENYKGVFSISGIGMQENKMQLPPDYQYDVYVSLRQLNSGWGTWSDRWQSINWSPDFAAHFLQDKVAIDSFARGGDDLIPMLINQIEGRIDAWDIEFTYNHFMHHAVSIIPRYSYVDNIGGDGSGTHHLNENENWHFDTSHSIQNPRLLEYIYEDKRIINAFYNCFCAKKRPLWKKLVNRISRLLTGKNVFIIKRQIYA